MKFSRVWAMPNHDTFSVRPIGKFVAKYLSLSEKSVDPFARDFQGATVTNDLNPTTKAFFHLDAIEFFKVLSKGKTRFDLLIFDPPYSPRQISECYKQVGRKVGMKETQSALLYAGVRDAALEVMADKSRVISFGWNTVGMGKNRGFKIEEIMLVCHGGAHNDTICLSEVRNK